MNTVYTSSSSRARLKPIARSGLADRVYDRLLESILHGEFASGGELSEVELARRLQVSRTPVREAIRRLAAEGLVVVSRNMRCRVTPFSRQDIVDTYEVRQLLEADAARRAATRIGSETLAELSNLAEQATPGLSPDWEARERQFDARLHECIVDAAGNARLRDEIQRITRLVQLVRSLVGRNSERLERGHTEHRTILAALMNRDGAAAQRAMLSHLETSLTYVLQDLPTT